MLRDKVASEERCRKETEDQYAAKVMEIQSLAEGLRAVTSELQLTKSQVVQVSSERGTLMEDVKNLTSRLSYFEQLICTKDEEEKALSNNLEQLVDEHQQLKLAAIELDAQAQQQSYQLQNMEELLRNTKEQSAFSEEECKKLKINFHEMEKQANVLSQSLFQQTAVLECVQKEKAALLAQISSSKQIILDLEKKNTSLMRELSTSESNSHFLSNILQGKRQEAESFTARYRFEHERVKELERVLACSRAQEHQHQLECKDLSAKNAILQERLTALENQVKLLQKTKESQQEDMNQLEIFFMDKYTEENKVVNAICSHAHKSLHYHDVIDPTDSKSKIHEVEMRAISLAADLSKTAALYKDCFSRLQKAEALCAEQQNEYEHVLSILSKVDDDRLQLQQRCLGLVNGVSTGESTRMASSTESAFRQSDEKNC